MTNLILLLSTGKGSWSKTIKIIKENKWDKIILICNEYSFNNFQLQSDNITKLKLNESTPQQTINDLSKQLQTKIEDFEIALNIESGTGLEHMILISSILKAGLAIRFIHLNQNNQLEELDISKYKILDEK